MSHKPSLVPRPFSVPLKTKGEGHCRNVNVQLVEGEGRRRRGGGGGGGGSKQFEAFLIMSEIGLQRFQN